MYAQREHKDLLLKKNRITQVFGWFARVRDDGTGLISCPWERVYVNDPDLSNLRFQRLQWRWDSSTHLKQGKGWAVIVPNAGEAAALQALRELEGC